MPHEPTAACEQDHCYWHHEDEPQTGVAVGVLCGECLHWYPSLEALEQADQEMRARLGIRGGPATPEDIHMCPLCSHDF